MLQPVGGRVKPLLGADRLQHLRGKVKQYIINTVGGSKPFLVHTLLQHLRGVISLIITVLPLPIFVTVECTLCCKKGFFLETPYLINLNLSWSFAKVLFYVFIN